MDNTERIVSEILDFPGIIEEIKEIGLGIVESVPGGIGKILTSYRMYKFNKRLKSVESDLVKIREFINEKQNSVFYKQEIFPLILNYIYNDDQDEKTKIYINGLEYTIKEGITEMEKIFHYFDVLSELRISDIVFLLNKYGPRNSQKLKINLPDLVRLSTDAKYREEYKEQKDLKAYMNNKLIRLGIVKEEMEDPLNRLNEALKDSLPSRRVREYEVKHTLTPFGERFINFFSTDDSTDE